MPLHGPPIYQVMMTECVHLGMCVRYYLSYYWELAMRVECAYGRKVCSSLFWKRDELGVLCLLHLLWFLSGFWLDKRLSFMWAVETTSLAAAVVHFSHTLTKSMSNTSLGN